MDADNADPRELARALRFIRRINALLRYNATMVKAVEAFIEALPGSRERRLTILDVAAGSGDLLAAVRRWSARVRRPLELIGLDRHATTLDLGAATDAAAAGVRFLRADALVLPFDDASIDVVTSTLFIHHLPEDVAIAALAEMRRVARHGVIVADLLRDRRAYVWITLFTLFASPMVKHDARASVAHAFTMDEARRLAAAAGMATAEIETTFGHRFMLRWRRHPR